jgi:hypothetical protein
MLAMLLTVPRRQRLGMRFRRFCHANDSASARLADRVVSPLWGDKYDPLFCVGSDRPDHWSGKRRSLSRQDYHRICRGVDERCALDDVNVTFTTGR